MNINFINLKLDLNFSNKEDVVRLQNAINYALNLNIGSIKIIKQEVHIFVSKNEDMYFN